MYFLQMALPAPGNRLMIKTIDEIMIVSLKEKEIFITEVMKRNNKISLS